MLSKIELFCSLFDSGAKMVHLVFGCAGGSVFKENHERKTHAASASEKVTMEFKH